MSTESYDIIGCVGNEPAVDPPDLARPLNRAGLALIVEIGPEGECYFIAEHNSGDS